MMTSCSLTSIATMSVASLSAAASAASVASSTARGVAVTGRFLQGRPRVRTVRSSLSRYLGRRAAAAPGVRDGRTGASDRPRHAGIRPGRRGERSTVRRPRPERPGGDAEEQHEHEEHADHQQRQRPVGSGAGPVLLLRARGLVAGAGEPAAAPAPAGDDLGRERLGPGDRGRRGRRPGRPQDRQGGPAGRITGTAFARSVLCRSTGSSVPRTGRSASSRSPAAAGASGLRRGRDVDVLLAEGAGEPLGGGAPERTRRRDRPPDVVRARRTARSAARSTDARLRQRPPPATAATAADGSGTSNSGSRSGPDAGADCGSPPQPGA